MSTADRKLSHDLDGSLPSGEGMRIAIIVSDWNSEITDSLFLGAHKVLIQQGVSSDDILEHHVPGSFELPFGAQLLAVNSDVDAIICLGCIVQGETRHFDFVAKGVTEGISRVSLDFHLPVIFGVLTTETQDQARERAGGKYGNKGEDAAVAALQMAGMQRKLEEDSETDFTGQIS